MSVTEDRLQCPLCGDRSCCRGKDLSEHLQHYHKMPRDRVKAYMQDVLERWDRLYLLINRAGDLALKD